ncbi:MAG: hypothetical protein PHR45_08685 [Muribaculaceae bacterium]|nr:hypothetical protein [Muribaculaceae bacterium]
MIRNIILACTFLASLSLSTSCSDNSEKEKAASQAIEVATLLINNCNSDEMTIQRIILDARSQGSEYILKGDTIAAQEYEKVFEDYIKAHNDSLAKILL